MTVENAQVQAPAAPSQTKMAGHTLAIWWVKLSGFGVLGTIAGIHLYLYQVVGFKTVPTIGWLFLLNVIASGLLALVMLVLPRGWVAYGSAMGAATAAVTLAGLLVFINATLFNFHEGLHGPLVIPTIIIESAGTLVMALGTAFTWGARTRPSLPGKARAVSQPSGV